MPLDPRRTESGFYDNQDADQPSPRHRAPIGSEHWQAPGHPTARPGSSVFPEGRGPSLSESFRGSIASPATSAPKSSRTLGRFLEALSDRTPVGTAGDRPMPGAALREDEPLPDVDAVFSWETQEFSYKPLERRLFFAGIAVLLAIIGYALFTDSPIMAITFILIGVTAYISIHRRPGLLVCHITETGVVVNREFYPAENIDSFWIFEEPGHGILSIRTNAPLAPYVHIPVHDEDVEDIRQSLSPIVPEEEHPYSVVDIIERMLHI